MPGSLQKGAVLLRSIVDIDVYILGDDSPPAARQSGQGVVGLRKKDKDDTTVLSINTDWLDEDWMQIDGWNIEAVFAVVATLTWADRSHARQRFKWDSKVKRKLTTDDEIVLSGAAFQAAPAIGNPITVDFCSRFLIQLP